MSIPRCEEVDPESIQILHVYNRCVRRSFLCGVDSVSGKDYSHRKQWIRDRLEFLTGIFAFDIATYAVMSNHFHLVLRSRPDIVADRSDREIAIRTLRLQGKKWFRENGTPRKSTEAEIERITSDPEEVQRLRRRLSDLSKFMLYFDRNLEVVEWAGRQLVPGKKGAISPGAPPILAQLGIEGKSLIQSIQRHAQRDRYFASTERNGIPEQPFATSSPRAG